MGRLVGFSGAPGAGKTSTARALAANLRRSEGFQNVELISEYARRYITKYGSIDCVQDQFRILQKQLDWENQALQYADLVITDSPIFLGFIYVMQLRKETQKDTIWVNDIFKEMSKLNVPRRYDLIIHLDPVIKPIDDGIRLEEHLTDEWRNKVNSAILHNYDIFPPEELHIMQETDLTKRVEECIIKISS
jgi:nicotinamide riboside kinase